MRPIFGGRVSRGIHGFNGVDLAAPRGTPILASAQGTVIIARASGWNGGYGKYIVLSHSNGRQSLYAHADSIQAQVGQYVAQGSQIATVGSTGNSTGSHVHFEIRGDAMPPEFLR
jgi:murein DD-endopeptidase MepM/ murein hydrolase activator NlpD